MAKPSNMGTYNQGLKYPDENPFQVAFEESAEKAKNLAEEAYTKKKEDVLDGFWSQMRRDIMMPSDARTVVTDSETGQKRLNKGFYDIANASKRTEEIIEKAKRYAEANGLPRNAIKDDDILIPRLEALHQEAAKRQYMDLAEYQMEYGEQELQELLMNEGVQFQKFWSEYTDPWDEYGSFDNIDPSGWTKLRKMREKAGDKRNVLTQEWKKQQENNGFTFNSKGQVTSIPWAPDPSSPLDVKIDNEGRPYVEVGAWSNFWNLEDTFGFGGADQAGQSYVGGNLLNPGGGLVNMFADQTKGGFGRKYLD